ncbi:MAG: hypothetical protein AAFO91_18695, partial [Bacteroidota bacterium]
SVIYKRFELLLKKFMVAPTTDMFHQRCEIIGKKEAIGGEGKRRRRATMKRHERHLLAELLQPSTAHHLRGGDVSDIVGSCDVVVTAEDDHVRAEVEVTHEPVAWLRHHVIDAPDVGEELSAPSLGGAAEMIGEAGDEGEG